MAERKDSSSTTAPPEPRPLPVTLLWVGVVLSALLFAVAIWLSVHADETVPRESGAAQHR